MLSARHDFWKGFWGALPFCFVVGPYEMMFGVLAAESGLLLWSNRTGGGHMGHWNWYWRMVGRARA